VPGQVTHAPRRLPRRRTQQDAPARAAADLDQRALRVRLSGAGKAGEEHERPGADELDDGPLLVRDVDRRPVRFLKQLSRRSTGALAEEGGEATLHLPELDAIGALALDDDFAGSSERAQRGFEWVELRHSEQPASALPQLPERQERVPIRLRLLEDEAQAGLQTLRIVDFDAERAGDPVSDLESDPRYTR